MCTEISKFRRRRLPTYPHTCLPTTACLYFWIFCALFSTQPRSKLERNLYGCIVRGSCRGIRILCSLSVFGYLPTMVAACRGLHLPHDLYLPVFWIFSACEVFACGFKEYMLVFLLPGLVSRISTSIRFSNTVRSFSICFSIVQLAFYSLPLISNTCLYVSPSLHLA